MKALLIKDLMTMKKYSMGILYGFIIIVFVNLISEKIYFEQMVPMLMYMMCVHTLTTITYDEYDYGYPLLFTLPFTRTQYVLSKYVLSILSILPIIIVWLIYSLIIGANIQMIFISLLLYIFASSLYIPIYLYFGSAKSTVAMVLLSFIIIGSIAFLFNLVGFATIIKLLQGFKVIMVSIGVLLFMLMSILISRAVMLKKDF